MPFHKVDKEKIIRHVDMLCKETKEFPRLTDILCSRDIFTDSEKLMLDNVEEPYARNFAFYKLLVNKDSSGFEILLDALKTTGQNELANTIDSTKVEVEKTKMLLFFNRKSVNKQKEGTTESKASSSSDQDVVNKYILQNKWAEMQNNVNLQNLRKTFKSYDTSGDGKLCAKKFYNLMKNEYNFSEAESRELMRANDMDGDGEIDYSEFVSMFFVKPTLCTDEIKISKSDFEEKDVILAERWELVVKEMIPLQFRHEISNLGKPWNKISRTLDCWISQQSRHATFDTLVQIVKKHSPKAAENLEHSRGVIKSID